MLEIVFVVLMILWMCGGSYAYWPNDRTGAPVFVSGTLLPWVCVAILGWVVFGGSHVVIR